MGRGRIGRARYFTQWFVTGLAATVLTVSGVQEIDAATDEVTLAWWVWPVWMAAFWLTLAFTAQRLHDVGWTGFLAPLVAAPFVGFFFMVALFLIPGERHINRYGGRNGEPPPSKVRNPYGTFAHHQRSDLGPPPAPGNNDLSVDGFDLEVVEYDTAAELRRLRAGDGHGGV